MVPDGQAETMVALLPTQTFSPMMTGAAVQRQAQAD